MDFRDRHIVVTGGAGALGTAVVTALIEAGAICHVPCFDEADAKRFHLRDHKQVVLTVTGNLADVVSNICLVRSFGAAQRERERLSQEIDHEMSAQRESLRALERLRLSHALAVFTVAAAMLAWAVELWRMGRITTGDVVLTTTLGFTVLHASRDLAMALVDLVQHFAKLRDAFPELQLGWTVRASAAEMLAAYREYDLDIADFKGSRFMRIARIKEQVAAGRLSETLRWR